MTTIKTLLALFCVLAFAGSVTAAPLMAPASAAVVNSGDDEEDPKNSEMTLTVKDIVDSKKSANRLKKDLMALKGVKNVKMCTMSGTVHVAYDKPELGCCSKIHSSLKDNGWEYKMVSNKEYPACSGDHDGHSHGHSKGAAKSSKKECDGAKKKECNRGKGA